jgi:hypothetical protein
MIPYSKDYIETGEVFADQSVFCMRCGTQIIGLSYREMPKINSPQETVKVAHRIQYGNYRQLGVVLYRRGRESITYLPVCQECVKEVAPETDSDAIIGQIMRAMQTEARWAGMPEETIQGIKKSFADAHIVRKLTPQELTDGRILGLIGSREV